MGAEVLETISKDREEFSRYFHYLKAEIDRDSQRIHAHRTGIEQGMAKGIEQGMAKGIEQGMAKGIEQGKAEMARNLLANGISPDIIAKSAGLSVEQVRSMMN